VLELAAPFRDLLSSQAEIMGLAQSFHDLLLKDQALPPPKAEPEPPLANGEDRGTRH
jgi:hypothetical protein